MFYSTEKRETFLLPENTKQKKRKNRQSFRWFIFIPLKHKISSKAYVRKKKKEFIYYAAM